MCMLKSSGMPCGVNDVFHERACIAEAVGTSVLVL